MATKINVRIAILGPQMLHLRRILSVENASHLASRYTKLGARDVATHATRMNRNPFDFSPEAMPSLQGAAADLDEVRKHEQRSIQEMEDAKAAALKMLSQRSHSRKELKLKLSEKGHPMTAIIGALDRLQHVGLQSDREFAEIFARSKWRQTKWGPGKIRSELLHRGIQQEDIDAALEGVFVQGLDMKRYLEEVEPDGGGPGPLASAEAALLQAAARQYERSSGLPPEARTRRLIGWLQRRGHKWDDIKRVMQHITAAAKN